MTEAFGLGRSTFSGSKRVVFGDGDGGLDRNHAGNLAERVYDVTLHPHDALRAFLLGGRNHPSPSERLRRTWTLRLGKVVLFEHHQRRRRIRAWHCHVEAKLPRVLGAKLLSLDPLPFQENENAVGLPLLLLVGDGFLRAGGERESET